MNPGRLMIAVGLLGFGALTLIDGDFGLDWQRVPNWVAARRRPGSGDDDLPRRVGSRAARCCLTAQPHGMDDAVHCHGLLGRSLVHCALL